MIEKTHDQMEDLARNILGGGVIFQTKNLLAQKSLSEGEVGVCK